MIRRLFFGSLVVPTLLIGMASGAMAGIPATLVVDDDGMAVAGDCSATAPTFATIPAAVAAASPGSTILVCPGTYDDGQIVVDKSLTMLGARAGDPIADCQSRGQESRVQASAGSGGTGAFWVQADDVVIDGFLIRNNAGPGIQTDPSTSGHNLDYNIIRDNVFGIFLNGDPSGDASRTRVRFNCISGNNQPGAASGTGIYTDQGLRTVSINRNDFELHEDVAVLFTSVLAPVRDVSLTSNVSRDDRTFLAIYGGSDYLIRDNLVRNAGSGFGDAGSAMYIGGGSDVGGTGATAVTLIGNDILSDHFAGIAIRAEADDVLALENSIRSTVRGIDVSSSSVGAVRLRRNVIRNVDQFGILLEANTSENQIVGNDVRNSGAFDCRDRSVGAGTAGTANTWNNDIGRKANPPAICRDP